MYCQHKEYCKLYLSDSKYNFCTEKGGDCRMENTDIKDLPLLKEIKESVKRVERDSRRVK